jgi:hypothetical protein
MFSPISLPSPNRFTADAYAALEQDVYDVSKQHRATHVHRGNEPDHFRRAVDMVQRVRGVGHI